jgi:hypothetical protein
VTLTWTKLYRNIDVPLHARSPVGSFWWKDVLKLAEDFRTLTQCITNKGNSVMFWQDNWFTSSLRSLFPQLFSLAIKPKGLVVYFLEAHKYIVFDYHSPPRIQTNWIHFKTLFREGVGGLT